MRYYSREDYTYRWVLYVLIAILSTIILINIWVAIWQWRLEENYTMKYEQIEMVENAYIEKYYLSDNAIMPFLTELKEINNEIYVIVIKNYAARVGEFFSMGLNLALIALATYIFKYNRERSKCHSSEIADIIFCIEIGVSIIICIINICDTSNTLGQYRQLYGLISKLYNELGEFMNEPYIIW